MVVDEFVYVGCLVHSTTGSTIQKLADTCMCGYELPTYLQNFATQQKRKYSKTFYGGYFFETLCTLTTLVIVFLILLANCMQMILIYSYMVRQLKV